MNIERKKLISLRRLLKSDLKLSVRAKDFDLAHVYLHGLVIVDGLLHSTNNKILTSINVTCFDGEESNENVTA